VSSAKKNSGVRIRASARSKDARAARDAGRDGGASGGGGGAAAGGNLRAPPPPTSPQKGNNTRSKRNSSFTAYRSNMLARVVRPTILGASPWAKRSLDAIQGTLNEYVSKSVTRVRALRVRDHSLKEMYGEWTAGQISWHST